MKQGAEAGSEKAKKICSTLCDVHVMNEYNMSTQK